MIITPGDINVTAAWSDFFFVNTVFNDIPYKPMSKKLYTFTYRYLHLQMIEILKVNKNSFCIVIQKVPKSSAY